MAETFEEEACEVIPDEFRKVVEQTFSYQSGGSVEVSQLWLADLEDFLQQGQTGDLMASLLSIDGHDMECHVVIMGCDSAIRSMSLFDVLESRDWLCELANLVAGGLKNQLWEYKVDSHLGLPANVNHTEWVASDTTWLLLGIESDSARLVACLQFDVPRDLMWVHDPEQDSMDDVCLF